MVNYMKGDVGVRMFSAYVHVNIVIVIDVVALTEKVNVWQQ